MNTEEIIDKIGLKKYNILRQKAVEIIEVFESVDIITNITTGNYDVEIESFPELDFNTEKMINSLIEILM